MADCYGARFGRLVRKKRGQADISQGELGKRVFASRSNQHEDILKQDVSKLETGKIRRPTARVIAKYREALAHLGYPISDEEMAEIEERNSPAPKLTLALMERNAALANELRLNQTLILEIARAYTPENPANFDSALASIEQALRVAASMFERREVPSNLEAQLNAVLRRVANLAQAGNVSEARRVLSTEQEDLKARADEVTQSRVAAEEIGIFLAQLENDPARAVTHVLARLRLDTPLDYVGSLCTEQERWLMSGRDKGRNFDLAVAIRLGDARLNHARSADERGSALLDLGNAFLTLGEREGSTEKLDQALEAFHEAASELTQDSAPLEWAKAQNALGEALWTIGEREGNAEKLDEALGAFRAALKEWTQERVPLDWARAQNNLGKTLSILGLHERNADRIEQAIESFHAALTEWTKDRSPFEWALAQQNLGNALVTLGEIGGGVERPEQAIKHFHAVLSVRTRDRVPLEWAKTQNSLGTAHLEIGIAKRSEEHLEHALEAFSAALDEWTFARMPLDWAMYWGNQGVALMHLADLRNEIGMAQQALAQIYDAEKALAGGGHVTFALFYRDLGPTAQTLVDRLST